MDFIGRFPESLYPCFDKGYGDSLINGYNVSSKSRCVITGLARNLGDHAKTFIYRLKNITNLFKSFDVVLYHNDSEDNTLDILHRESKYVFGRKYKYITIVDEKHNWPHHPGNQSQERMDHMAFYRNRCLEEVKRLDNADYIIVLDTDLQGGYSYDGLLNSISKMEERKIIGGNSIIYDNKNDKNRRLYYDAWAFRKLNHPHKHNFSEINPLIYHRGTSLVPVDSCFGGICIYPWSVLSEDVRYYSKDPYGNPECEHVTFNIQLKNIGYKCYMNPSMITLYNKFNGYGML